MKYGQDDWVPLSAVLRKAKLGRWMAKRGMDVMVVDGKLERRINPTTKETEYRISDVGKRLNMNWNAL